MKPQPSHRSTQLRTRASLTALQCQLALLSLQIAAAKSDKAAKTLSAIATEEVAKEAQRGLNMYFQHGGSEKLRIPEALAHREPLNAEDIDEILAFFENEDIDQTQPGWKSNYSPCSDWIRWTLLGGDKGWQWAKTTKELAGFAS